MTVWPYLAWLQASDAPRYYRKLRWLEEHNAPGSIRFAGK